LAARLAFTLAIALYAGASRAQWFPNGTHVTLEPGDQERPAITSDGRGGAIIAWNSSLGGVWVQRLAPDGHVAAGWPGSTGVLVGAGGCLAAHPLIVTDGAGGAFVVWDDSRRAPDCYEDEGDGLKEIYVQRVGADGVTTPGWPPAGLFSGSGQNSMSGTDSGTDFNTVAVADGKGGVIIAWAEAPSGPSNACAVRAQRVSGEGRLLWGPGGIAVCTLSSDQVDPKLVSDREGGAFVSWEDLRDAQDGYRIYGQHLSARGIGLWGAEGRRLTAGPVPHEQFQEMVSDGRTGLILVWQAGVTSAVFDVFAQHISDRGKRLWETDAPVSRAAGAQLWPAIAPAGRGGAWVAWVDMRSATNADIFAQLLTEEGRPARNWPADGAPVCTTPMTSRWHPVVAGDGRDAAYIGWSDVRHFYPLVTESWNYGVCRMTREGRAADGWPVGGFLLANPAQLDYGPLVMASDDRHGALVAWEQTGFPPADLENVLAQRLVPQGLASEADVPVRVASQPVADQSSSLRLALHGVSPNPGRWGGFIRFALSEAAPAALELFDVSGRKVWSRDVGSFGPGEHIVRIADGAWLMPGIYLARLVQGQHTATARAVILP
jgi:hypothetical protein